MGSASRSARKATTGPAEPTSATSPLRPGRRLTVTPAAECVCDEVGGVELLVAQLRMTMDLAPQRHRFGCGCRGEDSELLV